MVVEDEPRHFSGRGGAQNSGVGNDQMDSSTGANAVIAGKVPEAKRPVRIIRQMVPNDILEDKDLLQAMTALPNNYNLEIPKTIWRLRQAKASRVALQLPEGLQLYATTLSDIMERFAGVEQCFILGDVAYGACCVDDFTAVALGADFLIHYGHSCLVPIDNTQIPCMYVFVEIGIPVPHLVDSIEANFARDDRLLLAGTIQFASSLHLVQTQLRERGFLHVVIPQAKPLSPGEVLGCTAPSLPAGQHDAVIFVSDGRFHLEAFMIANPSVRAFRYDPYGRTLTAEGYDHSGMRAARRVAIEGAMRANKFGVVLGTLGRQGNPRVLAHVEEKLRAAGREYFVVLLSELSLAKLERFREVEAWVQIACPRLSIDWGEGFKKPLLTPYELEVAMGALAPWWLGQPAHTGDEARHSLLHDQDVAPRVEHRPAAGAPAGTPELPEGGQAAEVAGVYPMDYYARDGGAWNSHYPVGGALKKGSGGDRAQNTSSCALTSLDATQHMTRRSADTHALPAYATAAVAADLAACWTMAVKFLPVTSANVVGLAGTARAFFSSSSDAVVAADAFAIALMSPCTDVRDCASGSATAR
eukprot:jgi/Mesvir1/28948/Mv17726-RA.1